MSFYELKEDENLVRTETLEVVQILNELKQSYGSKKEMIKLKAIQKYNMDTNEKWVATKLRLILLKMGACVDMLAIDSKRPADSKVGMYMNEEVRANLLGSAFKELEGKSKLRVESQQLIKLRSLTFEDDVIIEETASQSKFLRFFGLIPVLEKLQTDGSDVVKRRSKRLQKRATL